MIEDWGGVSAAFENPNEAELAIVIIDMDRETTVTSETLHNNVGYTVYEGMTVKGIPDTTILRGKIIVDNNEFYGKKYDGKFVKRKIEKKILEAYSF